MVAAARDAFAAHAAQCNRIADLAVWALIEEAELTPKPALVDLRGPGAHTDLDVGALRRSARALHPYFAALFDAACGKHPGAALRERLAAIGREGEVAMLQATGGSNAHRGAIWTLGLLIAGSAVTRSSDVKQIAVAAAAIAHFPDNAWLESRRGPACTCLSHGERARLEYGAPGAREEASAAFPHVLNIGWPQLQRSRAAGAREAEARLDALLAIMASLADTCLLHRGGLDALHAAQTGAARVLSLGGCSSAAGRMSLNALHLDLMRLNASPGGAADLLAAVLFVDRLGGWQWK